MLTIGPLRWRSQIDVLGPDRPFVLSAADDRTQPKRDIHARHSMNVWPLPNGGKQTFAAGAPLSSAAPEAVI
jgi:hypothetical protein